MSRKEFDLHLSGLCIGRNNPRASVDVDLTPSTNHGVANEAPHDAEESSRLQAAWDKVVCHELATPYRYRKVSVLIVRWADHLDRDLKCASEVRTSIATP